MCAPKGGGHAGPPLRQSCPTVKATAGGIQMVPGILFHPAQAGDGPSPLNLSVLLHLGQGLEPDVHA
jgi:hypothetical protein